ncbi:hypothetical protein [Limnovirga soli]|uniref:Uncharacterized protein n=1 Tax=Limnovirga soli TaxID=2656915 RepID=A0A8J8JUY4_9BACT|nr:hypothetical protein [Limnovirga soli]NNV57528.1 hypothetical protein [Limnovirga soli]
MLLNIISGIVLSIVALFTYMHFKQKYIKARQREDFNRIFGDWKSSLPTLEFGSSYGWGTFTVTFLKKQDLDFAMRNKLTEEFKNCIQSYYGSRFRVDDAVRFRYLENE